MGLEGRYSTSRSIPFPRGNSNAYVRNIADHSWTRLKELAFFFADTGKTP